MSRDLFSAASQVRVVEHELPPRPRSAAEARRALDVLEAELTQRQFDDLRLLVTELVGNVVKHGELDPHDRLLVRVTLGERAVRAEVTQPGPAFRAAARPQTDDQESGWGLRMLELLTDRWGVRANPTTVWFEIGRDTTEV